MLNSSKQKRQYQTFNYPKAKPGGKTLLTGIRGKIIGNPCQVYISGFYDYPDGSKVDAFVYRGNLEGGGSWNVLNYPSAPGRSVTATNLYGPNNGLNDEIQVVGNYTMAEAGKSAIGCLYEGPLNGSGKWTTLIPSSDNGDPVINTIAHSTMGGLVVGNYDTQLDQGKAFIYDIEKNIYHYITKENAKSITAYGIWHNGGDSYTICGGYSNLDIQSGLDSGYLVHWNNRTKHFSDWTSYNYDNDPLKAIVTHFDGITSDGCGGYNLTGDWLGVDRSSPELAFFANVKSKHSSQCIKSKFGKATWSSISYPGNGIIITSGNSVYKNVVIGVYKHLKDSTVNGYISY